MRSAPFSSWLLDLTQLLRNRDLKTAEAPLPTRDAISVLSPWKDSPTPWKALGYYLSIYREAVCKGAAINHAANRNPGASKPSQRCCQHSRGRLMQEEIGKRTEIGKIYLISDTFLKLFKHETTSYQATSFQLLWYHKINLQLEKQHVCFYKVWKYKCSKC